MCSPSAPPSPPLLPGRPGQALARPLLPRLLSGPARASPNTCAEECLRSHRQPRLSPRASLPQAARSAGERGRQKVSLPAGSSHLCSRSSQSPSRGLTRPPRGEAHVLAEGGGEEQTSRAVAHPTSPTLPPREPRPQTRRRRRRRSAPSRRGAWSSGPTAKQSSAERGGSRCRPWADRRRAEATQVAEARPFEIPEAMSRGEVSHALPSMALPSGRVTVIGGFGNASSAAAFRCLISSSSASRSPIQACPRGGSVGPPRAPRRACDERRTPAPLPGRRARRAGLLRSRRRSRQRCACPPCVSASCQRRPCRSRRRLELWPSALGTARPAS